MKLLICTQVVDKTHPILGFFHRWIEELSKYCESVTVICLFEGVHILPTNVMVYSLGKERGSVSRARYAWRFWKLLWKLRGSYDAVFVHMNVEYILLGGFWWRLMHKRIVLWYVHKQVSLRLRLATFLSNAVATVSAESFRLQSNKVHIVGHGIDIAQYGQAPQTYRPGDTIHILTAGRVAPAKHILEMFEALDVLHARGVPFTFTVAGGAGVPTDAAYVEGVARTRTSRPYAHAVHLLGALPPAEIPALLAQSTVFLNLSTTGSIDKAVLEPLAAGVPAVTSNEAYAQMLSPYGLYCPVPEPRVVADALQAAASKDIQELQAMVRREHALSALVPRLVELLQ